MDEKQQFLETIRSNIEKYQFHVTTVNGGVEPGYCYTIGLSEILGFELIFAGGGIFLLEDVMSIIETIVEQLKKGSTIKTRIEVGTFGTFSFAEANSSWIKLMMLGVFDHYKTSAVTAYQIIPDQYHYTLDIPDMTKVYDVSLEPVWQWLVREWQLSIPKKSMVATNIKALLGEPITEVTRWETDEWQMFAGAGPDVLEDEMRVVSLGTILGIDESLLPAIDLEIGNGLWRYSGNDEWNDWKSNEA